MPGRLLRAHRRGPCHLSDRGPGRAESRILGVRRGYHPEKRGTFAGECEFLLGRTVGPNVMNQAYIGRFDVRLQDLDARGGLRTRALLHYLEQTAVDTAAAAG